jgi:hypothetical protein
LHDMLIIPRRIGHKALHRPALSLSSCSHVTASLPPKKDKKGHRGAGRLFPAPLCIVLLCRGTPGQGY